MSNHLPRISKKRLFVTLILPKKGFYSAVFGKRFDLHFVKIGRIWLNC